IVRLHDVAVCCGLMNRSFSSFSFVMQEREVCVCGAALFFIDSSTRWRTSGDILLMSIGGIPLALLTLVVSQRPGFASKAMVCPKAERAKESAMRQCFMRSSITLNLEFDPLRERQFAGPVHGYRLPAHVRLPCIAARFASASGVLFAAERAADFGSAGADVDV